MSSRNALAEELEVLKSIYNNDLRNDGSTIIITLFPLQEEEKKEIHAQIDLRVECSESYPQKEPSFYLQNNKGLSNCQIQILYSKLKEIAKTKAGEVMIYDLALCVREFLLEHNKPGRKSFYDEMLLRKEQQKQEEHKSEVYKLTKLKNDIKEKQEVVLKSTESDSSDDDEGKGDDFSGSTNKLRSNSITQSEETSCGHRNCKYIQFNNKILRGSCIEHDTNSIIYCAIDKTTGDQLLLQEWILKPRGKNSEISDKVRMKLESIQSELGSLKKLCHKNLISYIDFKWYFDKGEWVVHVLQEYIPGVSLNAFMEKNLDLNFIRHIIQGIFNVLDYLHSHDVVHGCLNASSIYFSKLGVVKVANYRIKKLIDGLHEFCKYETLNESNDKTSQKTDIQDVGYLFLDIMKLTSTLNETSMHELKNFIEKCLSESEDGRWTARKLLSHKFLKIREPKLSISRKKFSAEGDSEINPEVMEKPYDIFVDGNHNLNSRLTKEFKILKPLGTGSFGKVLKVKNRLDGSVYAIKAIRLNMKNKQLGKKMIREVKLLSKLNHENVVRYYTSWIETDSPSDQELLDEEYDETDSKVPGKISKSNVIQESEDEDEEDEEEEDDEEECDGIHKMQEEKDSSYIVFLKGSLEKNEEGSNVEKSREVDRQFQPNRTMYIQMEFCEKSTLRIAINGTCPKLCEEEPRLWRLFREIVEGLAYVHGQGMIHRDLKPENIFLDSSDHVKIGDFGLATLSAAPKYLLALGGGPLGAGDHDGSSQNMYDNYHTGKVGTSLYVAPEVDKTFEKSYYDEKVDTYSLGIIFFEMCNGPFGTDMERIETISNLRKSEIFLPPHWEDKVPPLQRILVELLLNHDPRSRPNCSGILEGGYLPPAEFEVEHFQEIMRQTLTNPKSKAYKYLVSSCFDQEVRIEDDVTYQWDNVRSEKLYFILDLVKSRTESILKNHGAVYLSVPLLLPQNKDHGNTDSRVKLMTHSGSIVTLPYDLRVSFARYVACKAFTRIRRYVVERVYREKKVHGLHPKEQYECAFDLITPSSGIEKGKLEVLSIIQEIINDFKSLKKRNCVIRINHTLLLKAVLIHFNSEKWYTDIFKILADAKETKNPKRKIEINLQELEIHCSNILLNFLTKEDSLNNVKLELLGLITKKGKALDMVKEAFDQLNGIIWKAEGMGIKVPIKIAMGVVCNSEHCSDIMFDVAYQVKQKKKKEETIVLMSGCRYDELIAKFRKWFELTGPGPGYDKPSAVGMSVYLDKIAAVLKEDNVLSEYVVIFSFGSDIPTVTKETVVKKLRESGIKCYVEETIQSLEELTEYCRENKIVHIVNLKVEESGTGSLMTWNDDTSHYVEKKINIRDVADHILKHSRERLSSPLVSRQLSENQNKPQTYEATKGSQNMEVHVVGEEKLTPTVRRKWEDQIRARVSTLAIFSSRARLKAVGVLLDEQEVKNVALNFKSDDSLNCYITDRNPKKKYVAKICTKVRSLLSENPNTVIILYSLHHDKYYFILES